MVKILVWLAEALAVHQVVNALDAIGQSPMPSARSKDCCGDPATPPAHRNDQWLSQAARTERIQIVLTAPRPPWMNAFMERWAGAEVSRRGRPRAGRHV
ncbi:MAG TPA: hypothetical protein VGP31_16330 [Planosporangium sp.]|jgi:hypothetical protein|nr:hypothetical protein [Planosporangium sp.]